MVHRKSGFEATLRTLVDIAELGGGVEYQSIDWAVTQPRFHLLHKGPHALQMRKIERQHPRPSGGATRAPITSCTPGAARICSAATLPIPDVAPVITIVFMPILGLRGTRRREELEGRHGAYYFLD